MLHFEFYVGVAKYAFCAFTAACLIAFLYSFVERLFPNTLLSRAIVSYEGPRKTLGLALTLIGIAGLLVSLLMVTTGSSLGGSTIDYALATVSAIITNIGALTYLMTQKMQLKEDMV
jgi:hypothetical protein